MRDVITESQECGTETFLWPTPSLEFIPILFRLNPLHFSSLIKRECELSWVEVSNYEFKIAIRNILIPTLHVEPLPFSYKLWKCFVEKLGKVPRNWHTKIDKVFHCAALYSQGSWKVSTGNIYCTINWKKQLIGFKHGTHL